MIVYLIFCGSIIILSIGAFLLQIEGLIIQKFIDSRDVSNVIVNSFFNKHSVMFSAIAACCNEHLDVIPKYGDSKRSIKFTTNYLVIFVTIFGALVGYLILMLPIHLLKISDDVFISDFIIFIMSISFIVELIIFYFRFRKFVFKSKERAKKGEPE